MQERGQIFAALDCLRAADSPCWQLILKTVYGHWDITITRSPSKIEPGQKQSVVFYWTARDPTTQIESTADHPTPEAAWNAAIKDIAYHLTIAHMHRGESAV